MVSGQRGGAAAEGQWDQLLLSSSLPLHKPACYSYWNPEEIITVMVKNDWNKLWDVLEAGPEKRLMNKEARAHTHTHFRHSSSLCAFFFLISHDYWCTECWKAKSINKRESFLRGEWLKGRVYPQAVRLSLHLCTCMCVRVCLSVCLSVCLCCVLHSRCLPAHFSFLWSLLCLLSSRLCSPVSRLTELTR